MWLILAFVCSISTGNSISYSHCTWHRVLCGLFSIVLYVSFCKVTALAFMQAWLTS